MVTWKQLNKSNNFATIGDLEIYVHKHIYYQEDMWLLSCSKLNIDNKDLGTRKFPDTAEVALLYAKDRAIEYVKEVLKQRIAEYKDTLRLLGIQEPRDVM